MKKLLPHSIWIALLATSLTTMTASTHGEREGGFVVKKIERMPYVIRMEPILIEGQLEPASPNAIDATSAQGWQPTECAGPVECLARIYFHEHEGGNRADHRLLFHVLARVAGSDRPSLRAMKAYSSRATGVAPPRSDRTRWIAQLRLDGARPPAYNRTEPWSEARPRWMAAIAAARADLRSTPPPPSCRYRADHWGGRGIDDRTDDGWFESQCDGTLNRGWCDPALGECHEEEEAEHPVASDDDRSGSSPDTA